MLSWVDRSYEEIVKDIQYSISSAYRVPKSRLTGIYNEMPDGNISVGYRIDDLVNANISLNTIDMSEAFTKTVMSRAYSRIIGISGRFTNSNTICEQLTLDLTE